jgi:hypothetical protein
MNEDRLHAYMEAAEQPHNSTQQKQKERQEQDQTRDRLSDTHAGQNQGMASNEKGQ